MNMNAIGQVGTPKDRSQVETWMENLMHISEEVIITQEELYKRLSPVLRFPEPKLNKDKNDDEPLVPIAELIRSVYRNVEKTLEQNRDILRRIEI